ncbi:arginyl-tRNA synthetase [Rickenella mellea]|uniref:arginine--tRNA ligase n=1 Tax=Rickenella mellea TaxID=50990 RepID=A0A4Y7PQ90_9AGAM|nr:arginyl-tRNA synthetase [Rickenella mellea]
MTSPELPRAVFDLFKEAVAKHISRSFSISIEVAFAGVDIGKRGHDFTIAVPRFRLKQAPVELVSKAVDEASFVSDEYLEEIIADGTFLHYYCRTTTLTRLVLEQVYDLSTPSPSIPSGRYGTNNSGAGKKVVIEFGSPNIAKPFHLGHLRSTLLGTFLSNLFVANGWQVVRMNYLGDWGKQFGLLAVGFDRYGSEEALSQNAIMHLFNVYVAINQDHTAEKAAGERSPTDILARNFFQKMEHGDPSALALWQRFRDLSIRKYEDVYQRLNVRYDVYGEESRVDRKRIKTVIEDLRAQGLLTSKTEADLKRGKVVRNPQKDFPVSSTGSNQLGLAVDLEKWDLGKPVVEKDDGTSIYITRDVAEAMQRFDEYHFDKMIYVVGDQQTFYMAQVFKILSLLNFPAADRLEHVSFGKVERMSTRDGEVKFLEEILDEAKEAMRTQMESNAEKLSRIEDKNYTADQVGMTCVKIQDMQAKNGSLGPKVFVFLGYMGMYKFNAKSMTSFEGNTGAYLQYAHVRLCSIERKVAPDVVLPPSPSLINTSLLVEPKAREIVFLIATYPEVVKASFKNYEPSTIVGFCFNLSHLISSAWETLVVKDQEIELAKARLFLFVCARKVLATAMRLLSLIPLEKM